MVKFRTATGAAFWDLNIAIPENIDGCAKAVPREVYPLDGARAGRAPWVLQLSLPGNGFPLGIIPSLVEPHVPGFLSSGSIGSMPLWIASVFFVWTSIEVANTVTWLLLRLKGCVRKNSGRPQGVYVGYADETPAFIMPGLCAKAAFSYEKNRDIWRKKETSKDLFIKADKGQIWQPAYDLCLRKPHATALAIIGNICLISLIIGRLITGSISGGTCEAWSGGVDNMLNCKSREDGEGIPRKRSPFFADLFGSACYTYQHGKFRKLYGDLPRKFIGTMEQSSSVFSQTQCHISAAGKVTIHNQFVALVAAAEWETPSKTLSTGLDFQLSSGLIRSALELNRERRAGIGGFYVQLELFAAAYEFWESCSMVLVKKERGND
ncbi:hypothetical protein Ancab_037614 [Ancistrocladus abbreviatus]